MKPIVATAYYNKKNMKNILEPRKEPIDIDPYEIYYVEFIKNDKFNYIGDRAQVIGTEYANLLMNECIKTITKEEFDIQQINKYKFNPNEIYYIKVITNEYPSILEFGEVYKKLGYEIPTYCTKDDIEIISKEEYDKIKDEEKVELEDNLSFSSSGDETENEEAEDEEEPTNEKVKDMGKENKCFVDKKDYERLVSQGKREDMNRLFEYHIEEFKKGGKREGIIKVGEEYAKVINEDVEEEVKNIVVEKHSLQTTIFRQLAYDFYDKQPFFFDSSKQWWLWNNEEHCWEVKDEIDIMNAFDKYFIQETEKSNIKSGLLEALRKCGRQNKPKDIKPTWVQYKNKIYDIETEEIFEATPKYFIANPIPWKVGETEDTPTIDQLFSKWVTREDKALLYELLSYTTIPEMFIHAFIFLYSAPGKGKGTFMNLLLNFIGRNNAVSTSITRINSNPRFETKEWHRKLLITMSEVSNVNDLKNSGLINQATGQDPIRAEVKGGGGFDYVNYGKFLYPTNKLLKVEAGDGFGRRVRTVKFQTRFEKEKDVLKDIPDEEYENLAKKCLRIGKELYERRRFTGDVDISERMSNYQEESKTPLERFINNYCDTSDFEEKVTLDEFFSKYNPFLKERGELSVNKSILAKELRKLGWETRRESMLSTQVNLDGSKKYDKKAFIYGFKMKKLDTQDTQDTLYPLTPPYRMSRDVGVYPVLPVQKNEFQRENEKEDDDLIDLIPQKPGEK